VVVILGQMKVKQEAELDRNECAQMNMCGFSLKDSKKNTEVRGLLGLEPVSLLIRKSTLVVWTC